MNLLFVAVVVVSMEFYLSVSWLLLSSRLPEMKHFSYC